MTTTDDTREALEHDLRVAESALKLAEHTKAEMDKKIDRLKGTIARLQEQIAVLLNPPR